MRCSRWSCSFLNQRSRIRPVGIKKFLVGSAFLRIGPYAHESRIVESQCRHRVEIQKKKEFKVLLKKLYEDKSLFLFRVKMFEQLGVKQIVVTIQILNVSFFGTEE